MKAGRTLRGDFAEAAQREAAPKLSVVVTNYNYGHFLPGCIASLQAQSVPPDEIVVVDDGSEDASADVLAAFPDIRVVRQANRGQAGAFNAGFAATTGDAILFLDADDQLLPGAVETVKWLWDESVGVLSFDLALVDAAGQGLGRYPIRIPDVDRRCRVLFRLAVPFVPTSGNVFSRARLGWAFPLPEPRWKISADALLVRCGLLSGRAVHLDRILGRYFAHGHNNYYDAQMSRPDRLHRGLADIADAGIDLIQLSRRAGAPHGRAECEAIARAAVETRLVAEMQDSDAEDFRRFLGRLGRTLRRAGVSALPFGLPVEAIGWNGRLKERVRQGWDRTHLTRSARQDPGRDADRDLLLSKSRSLDLPTHAASLSWKITPQNNGLKLMGASGTLRLRRLSGVGTLVRLVFAEVKPNTQIEIRVSGQVVARRSGQGRIAVEFVLSPPAPMAPEVEEIRIAASGPKPKGSDPALLVLSKAILRPVAAAQAVHELPVSRVASMRTAAPPDDPDAESPLELESGDVLTLAPPQRDPGHALRLAFGQEQVRGWLSLTIGPRTVLQAEIGPGATCLAQMPDWPAPGSWRLELAFQPEDPLEAPRVEIASLGWVIGADPAGLSWDTLHMPAKLGILGDGWEREESGAALLLGATGVLRLPLPPMHAADQPVANLDLEPLDPIDEADELILVATSEDAVLSKARLRGRGIFSVPLRDASGMPADIVLHATPIPVRRHSGVRLHSVQLTGGAAHPAEGDPVAAPRLSELGEIARRADAAAGCGDERMRSARRSDLLARLPRLSDGGARLVTPQTLEAFAALGASLPRVPAAEPPAPSEAGEAWLRWIGAAMLSGPAWRSMPGTSLRDFPPGAPDFAETIGRYLAANPRLADRDEATGYGRWLIARLAEARSILKTSKDGWHRALAERLVRACRPNALLFHDGPIADVVSALSETVETLLLEAGHDLLGDIRPGAARTDEGRRTRLAVVLRDSAPAPEIWIARALFSGLDTDRFEITVYLCDTASPEVPMLEGVSIVALGGRPLSASVAEIRAWQPDIALIGSFFFGYGPTAAIAAHRLAPRQIAMSAVFPATSGLRSVDTFIAGDAVTPCGAEEDYAETVVRAPGTGQAFDFGDEEASDAPWEAAAWRARMGLGADTVLLVSGAMRDKIVPELIDAWVRILAGAPEATLLVYPFAPNWVRDYDTTEFQAVLRDACLAGGVDPSRLRALAPMPRSGVTMLLRRADLYLDSFPYSGATTVVEALSVGLPVVSRAGQSQRCHQGSGWLAECGLADCVARDTEGYVATATELASDAPARCSLRARLETTLADGLSQREFKRWFAGFLRPEAVPPQPRYIFHHMPKTGGTSTRQIFSQWFNIVGDYRAPWSSTLPEPRDLGRLGPDDMLCGHFGAEMAAIDDRYPEARDTETWRRITFVRDPLETALSTYFFEEAKRGAYDDTYEPRPIGEFLRTYGGLYKAHFSCTEDNWREALQRYWFIGTLERLDECIAWLARALGKPIPEDIDMLNVTERLETPDPADVAAFVERNRLEFDMYREISARLATRLGEPEIERMHT